MKYTLTSLSLGMLLSFQATANNEAEQSQEKASNVTFSVYGGLADGGDKLATIDYVDEKGRDAGGDNIKAGGLMHLGAGANFKLNNMWSIQANLGYFFDSDAAENADINMKRFVLEAIPYYHLNEQLRFGIGLTYHLNPEFEVDYTNIYKYGIEFDNAAAAIFSLGYTVEDWNSWFELRYVPMEYTVKSVTIGPSFGFGNSNKLTAGSNAPKKDGDHIGITWHYTF